MSLDPNRPNILWVSFEDTNPFYGCYGDPVTRTPVVDQLRRFNRVSPRRRPTLAALLRTNRLAIRPTVHSACPC